MSYKNLTPELIIKYANEKNIPFEFYTNRFDRWNDRGTLETTIGLELKKDVWFWWDVQSYELDAECNRVQPANPYLTFVERYNRNNGASIKSWRKGFEARNIILNELNK